MVWSSVYLPTSLKLHIFPGVLCSHSSPQSVPIWVSTVRPYYSRGVAWAVHGLSAYILLARRNILTVQLCWSWNYSQLSWLQHRNLSEASACPEHSSGTDFGPYSAVENRNAQWCPNPTSRWWKDWGCSSRLCPSWTSCRECETLSSQSCLRLPLLPSIPIPSILSCHRHRKI